MERFKSPILALGLIFGTLSAPAAPTGVPENYALQTKYSCQSLGVVVRSARAVISQGDVDEVNFVASPGRNQALTFGAHKEAMIWPRVTRGTFNKSFNVLTREASGSYKIVQEVDMGETQKTKTNVSILTKDEHGEERSVFCRIEMEWIKKRK